RRGAQKQPFLIRRRDRKIFAMAGIWEDWLTVDGSELDSCAIVTTAANETLAPIHQRMPVILEQSDWDTWLDVSSSTKAARALLKPAANDLMEAVPITTRVNKVSEDDASLLEPIELGSSSDPSRKMPKKKDKDQLPLL
ncbi:MAG: SOS response-associated peptidase, partial [Rhodobiaceae bacterium]|nr:SOS response-associated peptidase [Rhodobiaceae bacterium]